MDELHAAQATRELDRPTADPAPEVGWRPNRPAACYAGTCRHAQHDGQPNPRVQSPQMVRLLASYRVGTERELVRAIAHEWTEETGSRVSLATAALLLDEMLEATYQRMQTPEEDR